MLGSFSEADDAVQEAWFRLSQRDASDVENLAGWLTTVVARVCLDMLRSRNARREEPHGDDLPWTAAEPADKFLPEDEALLADSVGLALLAVLNTLTPAERLAFVLQDMFEVPFDEIAPILERSPGAGASSGASPAVSASATSSPPASSRSSRQAATCRDGRFLPWTTLDRCEASHGTRRPVPAATGRAPP